MLHECALFSQCMLVPELLPEADDTRRGTRPKCQEKNHRFDHLSPLLDQTYHNFYNRPE
jgi:hypothetical protein